MERELFGGSNDLFQRVAATANAQIENDDPAERLHDGKGADKGFIIADIASDVPIKPQGHASKQKKKRKAAWVDPDTEKTNINIQDAPRLRKLKALSSEAVMQGANLHAVCPGHM